MPETYRIRPAILDDYDHLVPLFAEAEEFHRVALPHIFQKPPEGFPSRELFTSLVEGSDSDILMAEAANKSIGFVAIREDRSPDDPMLVPRRFGMVDMLAVRKGHQRQGIGSALMAAAREWALERRLQEISLTVCEFNQPAIEFYLELGYETVTRQMMKQVRAPRGGPRRGR